MKLFLLALLFLATNLEARAQTNQVSRDDSKVNLNRSLRYFVNSNEEISFREALERLNEGKFQPHFSDEALNFGYNPNDYWFYAEFTALEDLEKVLYLPYPYHQFVNLHIKIGGEWQHVSTGNLRDFASRGVLKPENFAWPLDIGANDEVQILVNIRSRSPIIISLDVLSVSEYIQTVSLHNLIYGLFYGVLFIMFLYNLFIYIILRDRAFLYYLLLVLTNIAVFASVTGYAFKYLHPGDPEVNFYIREFLITFLIIPTSLFAISFLDLKKYSRSLYYLLLVMIAIGVLICTSILLGYTFGFSSLVISIQAPLLLVIGVIVRIRGNKNATFYIIAWSGYLIGGMAMTLRNRGILPATFITDHGAEIGAILEVFLLALALANRYRQIRNEKSRLQKENIELVRQQNLNLERKVKERTKLLGSALDMVQKQYDDLSNKNLEITSSMNYALKIQEAMLPDKDKLASSFADVALLYKPKETVSGDFFFFEKSNDKLFVAVADCTGHGVPGALLSMAGYNLFYDAISVEKIESPRAILEYIDKNLRLRLNQKDDLVKDGMEAALCVIDKRRNEIKFSGAQRPLVIINRENKAITIKGSKKGIVGHMHHERESFVEHVIPTNECKSLYLFSDGFQDQFGGKQDKKYLSKRLKVLLEKIADQPGSGQEQALDEEFSSWKGTADQVDDVIVLGLKL